MCLRLEEKFKTKKEAIAFTDKPLKAKRNITAYKLLEVCQNSFEYPYMFPSPYKGAIYEPGKNYQANAKKKFSFEYLKLINNNWAVGINKGIHSFRTKEALKEYMREQDFNSMYIIASCRIPKGSKYFKNKTQYVSVKIQVPYLTITEESKNVFKFSKEWELV